MHVSNHWGLLAMSESDVRQAEFQKAMNDQASASARAEAAIKSSPYWFHSIELAPGIMTPGRKSPEQLEEQVRSSQLPDLRGKTVLDIGAFDGYFSFVAERLGAAKVTALDHYVWSFDQPEYVKARQEAERAGPEYPPPHESRQWRPDELPGRRPFDMARAILGSKVEPVVGDFMTMDLSTLGQFDVVLYLGVLYHMEDPLRAMRRVFEVTAPGGLVVIQSNAMEIPRLEDRPMCEFIPGRELNNDPSNWWIPNAKALEGLCRAAGFREVTIISGRPVPPRKDRLSQAFTHFLYESRIPKRLGFRQDPGLPLMRYAAYAHARR
jgi:tRNA (mo5U34)-methyltransferase